MFKEKIKQKIKHFNEKIAGVDPRSHEHAVYTYFFNAILLKKLSSDLIHLVNSHKSYMSLMPTSCLTEDFVESLQQCIELADESINKSIELVNVATVKKITHENMKRSSQNEF